MTTMLPGPSGTAGDVVPPPAAAPAPGETDGAPKLARAPKPPPRPSYPASGRRAAERGQHRDDDGRPGRLLGPLQMLVLGGSVHQRSQDLLYRDFREQFAEPDGADGRPDRPGTPVALVAAPAIGMDEVVVEGTASGTCSPGPGTCAPSVLPGQDGRAVLMGRGASYGAPFGEIGDLEAGDLDHGDHGPGREDASPSSGCAGPGDPEPQPRPPAPPG